MKLTAGHGWVDASIKADNGNVTPTVEVGAKLSPNWAAYGDAWYNPYTKVLGQDLGLEYKNNLELYANAEESLDNSNISVQSGVKWRF